MSELMTIKTTSENLTGSARLTVGPIEKKGSGRHVTLMSPCRGELAFKICLKDDQDEASWNTCVSIAETLAERFKTVETSRSDGWVTPGTLLQRWQNRVSIKAEEVRGYLGSQYADIEIAIANNNKDKSHFKLAKGTEYSVATKTPSFVNRTTQSSSGVATSSRFVINAVRPS